MFLLHTEKNLSIAKWPGLTPKKKKRRKKSFVGSTPDYQKRKILLRYVSLYIHFRNKKFRVYNLQRLEYELMNPSEAISSHVAQFKAKTGVWTFL